MAVTKNKPGFKHTPASTLSKQAYVTKPEKRGPETHNYGVAKAEAMVKKMCG